MAKDDFYLPAEERRHRASTKKRITLGDIFDFDKIQRKLEGKDEPEETTQNVKDPLDYIDRGIKAIEELSCHRVQVPEPHYDLAIMWNWITFRGKVDRRVEELGYKQTWIVNYMTLRAPCLIVKRSLLRSVNVHFQEMSKIQRMDLIAYSLEDFRVDKFPYRFDPDMENCCVGVHWGIDTFVTRATTIHSSPLFDERDKFIPSHHIFRKIPGTHFVLAPLQPKPGVCEGEFCIDHWDINYDAEVVVLEDNHE